MHEKLQLEFLYDYLTLLSAKKSKVKVTLCQRSLSEISESILHIRHLKG